ncbi:hypothetical protein, partial [Anabaena sp. FACHB-83]
SKLSLTVSNPYGSVFTKISKFCLKALNNLALEFSDKSFAFACDTYVISSFVPFVIVGSIFQSAMATPAVGIALGTVAKKCFVPLNKAH